MKKVLIFFISFLFLIIIALALAPFIFKDDIKKAIDEAIVENVDAQVYFDPTKFGLSFFSHFPSLSVNLEDFGVVNNAPFQGDTLISVQKFEIAINVLSLFGDKIQLNGIYLNNPRINVKILKDGKANYDIAKSTETATEEEVTTEEPSAFSIGIKNWEIKNADIRYTDLSSDMKATIQQMNHSGSGDFTQSVFDLTSNTSIAAIDFDMEGTKYLSNNSIDAEVNLNMDLDNSMYTFKENNVRINQFVFGFDGSIILGEDFQEYDLTFNAVETEFKNILSLVPAVFTKDFETLKTSGSLSFDGFLKGKLQDELLPDFGINLKVNDGMFQYPDLPSAVTNVNIDLQAQKVGSSLEATEINLSKFHMDLGKNPIDITAKTKGLETIEMAIKAIINLNLADISSFYPIEGLELAGTFGLNADVNGVYSESNMPSVNADLKLENGLVKSIDVPFPLENIQMIASAKSPGGVMENSSFDVESFTMTLDGKPVEAFLHLKNFDDFTYNTGIKGQIDIGKMMKIFPQEGMNLAGLLSLDIETSGKMSDIDAERYDLLPTSGNLSLMQFSFSSVDLPQGMSITMANLIFSPKEALLRNYKGTLGNSDMQLSGSFSNYIGYVLKDQTLKGNMIFNSNKFDLNEWMTEEESTSPEGTSSPEEELLVEPIPQNIDFVLTASMDKILYEDSDIDNLTGKIIIRNGAMEMQNTAFNMLGGSFLTSGIYDTKDSAHPFYSFDLKIKNLEIPKAYASYTSIQDLAPMAKNMSGNMNTDFHVQGKLFSNYDPDLSTMTGGGVLNIFNASLKEFKLISKLNQAAKFAGMNSQASNDYPLKDFMVKAEIRDGKVFYEPFDITAGNNKLTIGGNYGLDGQLDYLVKSDVQASALTGAAASVLNSFTGSNLSGSGPITMNFGVTGTQEDPQIKLLGVDSKDGTPKNIANTAVTNVKAKANDEAMKKAQIEADKVLKEAERNANKLRAEGKRSADLIRSQSNKQADDLVKNANNPIAKRAAQEAAKKMRSECDKNARKVEDEANRNANNIMSEARKKADQIIKNP